MLNAGLHVAEANLKHGIVLNIYPCSGLSVVYVTKINLAEVSHNQQSQTTIMLLHPLKKIFSRFCGHIVPVVLGLI